MATQPENLATSWRLLLDDGDGVGVTFRPLHQRLFMRVVRVDVVRVGDHALLVVRFLVLALVR